ncbi:MAG: DUF971 domain-containing protein [Bacteroidota bacterium]|jgi:DUF971 family protein|nr:DUF971 domain-containing protein [Bacteroidota bacterium]
MLLHPTGFKLIDGRDLRITWSDGHIVHVPIQRFRDECPCASCQGESDIFGTIRMPMQLQIAVPGKYELKSLTPLGNYAVAALWGDGHDSGIYSWDYLRAMEARLDTPTGDR